MFRIITAFLSLCTREICNMKCLFTNIQKQQNMLKRSLLFKKKKNFVGKELDNSQGQEFKISRALFLFEPEHIVNFSNLHQCRLKAYLFTLNYVTFFFDIALYKKKGWLIKNSVFDCRKRHPIQKFLTVLTIITQMMFYHRFP